MIAKGSFHALTEHIGYFTGTTNVGLVISGPALFLIDSGDRPEDGEQLATSLRELFPGRRLKAIIHTHGHSDHCGGSKFLREHTGCEIWAPKTESTFIENPGIAPDIYWGGRHFDAKDVPVFQTGDACKVDRLLEEGLLDEPDVSFKLVPLPGHFYDQLGLVVSDKVYGKKAYFLGDAFFGIEMIKNYWIPFMQDQKLFRESLCKIENEEADLFVPSHGMPFNREKLPALAEINKLLTLEMESLILRIIARKPSTCEEILKEVADFAGLHMKLSQYVLIGSTLRSYISRLYNDGKLRYTMEENRLLWSINIADGKTAETASPLSRSPAIGKSRIYSAENSEES